MKQHEEKEGEMSATAKGLWVVVSDGPYGEDKIYYRSTQELDETLVRERFAMDYPLRTIKSVCRIDEPESGEGG